MWSAECVEQDEHEVEGVLEGSDGGSVTSQTRCRKYPDHAPFIPVPDFGVDKVGPVAPGLSKQEVVDYVLTWAALVVWIVVHAVSPGRPESQYPFSNRRGQRIGHVGSGWVWGVSGPEGGLCRCGQCLDTGAKKTELWEIRIQTARHVVYDAEEASQCDVVFFDEHPDGRGAHRLSGHGFGLTHTQWDKSGLICYTCDQDLAGRLQALCEQRVEMREKMNLRVEKACVQGEGLDDRIRQRVTELRLRNQEIEESGEEQVKILKHQREKIDGTLCHRLNELMAEGRERGMEIDSRTRQTLLRLTDKLKKTDGGSDEYSTDILSGEQIDTDKIHIDTEPIEFFSDKPVLTNDSDKFLVLNLLDRLDKMECGERQTFRQLWESRDEMTERMRQASDAFCRQRCEIEDSAHALWSDVKTSLPSPRVLVISHPHGRMKYITAGQAETWVREDVRKPVTYRVPTCPGSSGGLVLALPTVLEALLWREVGWWVWPVPRSVSHSRAQSPQVGASVSGALLSWL